jgi:S1-C subfamily serine protease
VASSGDAGLDLVEFGEAVVPLSVAEWTAIQDQEPSAQGVLGLQPAADEQGRILVANVLPGSPAEEAGLEIGDQIVSIGGVELLIADDVLAATDGKAPGATLELVIIKVDADSETTVTAVLADADDLTQQE